MGIEPMLAFLGKERLLPLDDASKGHLYATCSFSPLTGGWRRSGVEPEISHILSVCMLTVHRTPTHEACRVFKRMSQQCATVNHAYSIQPDVPPWTLTPFAAQGYTER